MWGVIYLITTNELGDRKKRNNMEYREVAREREEREGGKKEGRIFL